MGGERIDQRDMIRQGLDLMLQALKMEEAAMSQGIQAT